MKKGYSLIDLLIAVAVMVILFSLGSVIYRNFVRQDSFLTESLKIKSLINEARMKTVAGFSLGETQALNFGLYFQNDRCFLFPGTAFSPENVKNQEFILPTSLEIETVTFPAGSLVFEKISGEVRNYDPLQNFLILKDKQNLKTRKISVNQLGTVLIEDQ